MEHVIEFEHKLPSRNCDGKKNGTYNNYELGFPSVLTTEDPKLGLFLHTLRSNIYDGRKLVFIDGKILKCQHNWIRDHVHILKAARHWEYDLSSLLNFYLETQREDGQFYELIKQYDDYHWKMVDEDCRVMYPEDNLTLVRLELEADIEYLMVEGAGYLYKTTGDDEWLRWALPRLEKGIDYLTSDEKRWDAERGLVKRPFTIDTWDFQYDPAIHDRVNYDRRVRKDSPMSVFHGDNSGAYAAMRQLAWFRRRLGDGEKAAQWEARAETLRENMFRYLWNGSFFIHMLHLNHEGADGREAERLSLSNAYDMNRGVTDLASAQAILEEYRSRRKTTKCFSEWFSIDPPYPEFNGYVAGEYVNGAISPFTAGELAKAALENGREEYGWDILQRFMALVERDGAPYFLYHPDSRPQPENGPSAWGAASLISAVDESLAGVRDAGVNYDEIDFSPRFPVTYYRELRYLTGYEVTNVLVDVRYILKEETGMRYDLYSPAKKIRGHVLLPRGRECRRLLVNGREQPFRRSVVGESVYADFTAEDLAGYAGMEILF